MNKNEELETIKTIKVDGIIIDEPTINNRIYTKEELEKMLNSPLVKEILMSKAMYIEKYSEIAKQLYSVVINDCIGFVNDINIKDNQIEVEYYSAIDIKRLLMLCTGNVIADNNGNQIVKDLEFVKFLGE